MVDIFPVEGKGQYAFPENLTRAQIMAEWGCTLCAWAHWQHACCKFEPSEPHQPSKDEERALLDIFDLYTRASSMFEIVAKEKFQFVPDGSLNQMTLDHLLSLKGEERVRLQEERRKLLAVWADAVDGFIVLRTTYSLMDAGVGYDLSPGEDLKRATHVRFLSLTQAHAFECGF